VSQIVVSVSDLLLIVVLASTLYIPVALKTGKYFAGLLASSATIAAMFGLAALSLTWVRLRYSIRVC
jgi:hypothetical protein